VSCMNNVTTSAVQADSIMHICASQIEGLLATKGGEEGANQNAAERVLGGGVEVELDGNHPHRLVRDNGAIEEHLPDFIATRLYFGQRRGCILFDGIPLHLHLSGPVGITTAGHSFHCYYVEPS
jgi:hypothetical protein